MHRSTHLSLLFAVIGLSCSGGEPHPCDDGTPTCDSSLLVLLPDPRTEFTLAVSDELGLDITVDCPLADATDNQLGDYTVYCGAGRLQIDTFRHFGDAVDVQLEEAQTRDFSPDYSKGGDFCGNACTSGTIQL